MHPSAEIEFFQTSIAAPVEQVYRCFTRGVGFQEWLSNGARTFPQAGGMVSLWWNYGYYMVGEFTRLEPNAFVSFIWHGRGEPQPSQVQVQLIPENGGTRVDLTHQGLGSEEIWVEPRKEIRLRWERGLENLKSVLETGKDLRVINRPGMGIYPAEVSAEAIRELGFPVDKGILLKQVIEGYGAEKAGLAKDDLLVELDGAPISTIEAIFSFLNKQTLGSEIKATYYRGNDKRTCTIELMQLPSPDVPQTYQELLPRIETTYRDGFQALKEVLEGITAEAAVWKPEPKEWSILETLAHLIHNERDVQYWIHSKILDEDFEWLDNSLERGTATVAVYTTVKELLDEFERAKDETLALVKRLPDSLLARKSAYWNIAQGLLTADEHIKEHIDQIQQNLNALIH